MSLFEERNKYVFETLFGSTEHYLGRFEGCIFNFISNSGKLFME